MNEKEIGELRRRFRPDRRSISHVRGCYVSAGGEILSRFDQSLAMMSQEESEQILTILRKTLSGTLGKNLMDIVFETRQVADSPEHRLLMTLRESHLGDETAVEAFFEKAIGSLVMEDNYMILLAHDVYDVPWRGGDGEEMEDASDHMFSYILCAVCPVKRTKPALSYQLSENVFRDRTPEWLVSPPEAGFLFPAFDQRCANLYGALYYARDGKENHPDFAQAVFCQEVPMPAAEQREIFQNILGDALEEECRCEVVQAVQDAFCGMIAEHKEQHETEPLVVSRGAVQRVLDDCGISEERTEAFGRLYDEAFGEDTVMSPRNLVDPKQMEVKMGEVTIRVSAQRGDLLEMRRIDGAKYILIRAEDEVTVNGVSVRIP